MDCTGMAADRTERRKGWGRGRWSRALPCCFQRPGGSEVRIEQRRDSTTMQNSSKLFVAYVSSPPWADLLEVLLQSIVAKLGSICDILAFAATCRSWRVAISSYPSKSTLYTKFPPLLIQPSVSCQAPHLPFYNGQPNLHTYKIIDPANENAALRCQIPQETVQKMFFIGSSYGHLIYTRDGDFLIVDVFAGAEISPPCLPFIYSSEEIYYSGILTAPLTSPNSHLLINTAIGSSLFDWPVGSDYWYELKLSDVYIDQIVEFNGQFIVLDFNRRIHSLQLAPQLGLQEITTKWCGAGGCPSSAPWLMVCGDMLLTVHNNQVYHLDMSTEPAKWMDVKKLDNWVLFAAEDLRSPSFSCVNPERWGGRSNSLYYAHRSQSWSVMHGFDDESDAVRDPSIYANPLRKRSPSYQLEALWVYPSMFYIDNQ